MSYKVLPVSDAHRRMSSKMQNGRASCLRRWTTDVVIFLIIMIVFVASLVLVKKPGVDSITSAHPLVRPARAKAMMSVGIGAKLLDMEACAHAGQALVGSVRVVPHSSSDCSPAPAADVPTCTPRVGCLVPNPCTSTMPMSPRRVVARKIALGTLMACRLSGPCGAEMQLPTVAATPPMIDTLQGLPGY